MSENMRTIGDLRKEKIRLRQQADLTLNELKSSLQQVKGDGQRLALKKFVLPASAVGLSAFGIKKILDSLQQSDDVEMDTVQSNTSSSNGGILQFLLKHLPFLYTTGKNLYDDGHLSFLFGNDVEEDEEV